MAIIDNDDSVSDTFTLASDDVSNGTRTLTDEWVISVPNHDDPCIVLPKSSALSEDVTVVLIALRDGNIAPVKEYVSKKTTFSVESVLFDGKTMLHYACIYGHVAVVQYIVQELRANVNSYTKDGKTALHFASSYGKVEIVKFLLEQDNVNIKCKQSNGWTALHIACNGGFLRIVDVLLENCGSKDFVDAKQNDEWTALHLASRQGHFDVVRNLHIALADVDITARDDRTALHFACCEGHEMIVEYLWEDCVIKSKADQYYNWSAVYFAAQYGHFEIVKYLCREGTKKFPGHTFVDWVSIEGKTILHIASIHGHVEIVKHLLTEEKASPYTTTIEGLNALHLACQYGHLEIVRFLAENSYIKNIEAFRNTAPVLGVQKLKCTDSDCSRQQLVTSEENKLGKKGATFPLHFAILHDHLEIVKYLLPVLSFSGDDDTDVSAYGNEDTRVYDGMT